MEPDIAALAAVALTDEGRRTADTTCGDRKTLEPEKWAQRYRQLVEDLSDDPSDSEIVVAIGERGGTIGWVDWSGEDDEHQVQDMVVEACEKLGLPDPGIPDDITDHVLQRLGTTIQRGDYIPALLEAIDTQLAAAGLRLVLIDLDTDTYHFVPVTAEAFASLVGRQGGGYRLQGIDADMG